MKLSYKYIAPLILRDRSASRWLGYIGLAIGMTILLLAVQMFINIRTLLNEQTPRHSGEFDFVSISKTITNENMGKDNRFTAADIELLKKQPQITAVAPLYSNQFSARASAGSILPFSTDMFLESLNKDFLDTLPANFSWEPGQAFVPMIFSSDFLEMYNVFAPSQGLPQLSAKTISSVNIILECSGPGGSQNFRAGVVGLSDRVNSILVPESFIRWANLHFSGDTSSLVSRVYIKTPDINNPSLIQFLDGHQFHINQDKIRFGRLKDVLQKTIGAIGLFGILVLLLALVLFGFYLRLIITKSRDNIRLLLLLGYSPSWLSRSFLKNFLPVYLVITIVSVAAVSVGQFLFSRFAFAHDAISPVLHWVAWTVACVLLILILIVNTRMARREIAGMN